MYTDRIPTEKIEYTDLPPLATVDFLVKDIQERGQLSPISVVELPYRNWWNWAFGIRHYRIIKGNGRLSAQRQMGNKLIWAIVYSEGEAGK